MPHETILAVDDNRQFLETLTTYMLTPLGYRVLHAPDGRKGLQMATTQAPDLILLDMNMPRMTGLEMLAALRQTTCRAPVVFMTMDGSEQIAVEAFRLGVRDYLAKPFTMEELQLVLDRTLQESRLLREKEALTRNLIASETVRQTVVTLSHYINNYLMILMGNLSLIQKELPADLPNYSFLAKSLQDSQSSAKKVEAVLRVLRRVTHVEQTTYHGDIKMIDIEAALQKELKNLKQ
jgi:two-component system NtrC family sensor kinase